MASEKSPVVFEDYFPAMMEKLGTEGFMKELANGFQLLMDTEKNVITFESLKRSSALLGVEGMSDEDIMCMLREGDMDGDGALDEIEFNVLMFRIQPVYVVDAAAALTAALKDDGLGGPEVFTVDELVELIMMSFENGADNVTVPFPIAKLPILYPRGVLLTGVTTIFAPLLVTLVLNNPCHV